MAEEKAERREYTTNYYKTDIDKVSFLGSPHMDNVVTTLIAMGNEMWTNRKRVKVLESLLAEKGVSRDMVEQYVPSEEQEVAWKKEREVLVDRLYGHFARQDEFTFASDFESPTWGK